MISRSGRVSFLYVCGPLIGQLLSSGWSPAHKYMDSTNVLSELYLYVQKEEYTKLGGSIEVGVDLKRLGEESR